MLKVFRDNLKQWHWVLWLVIAVFILLVFADFGGARFGGGRADGRVATVGNEPVSMAEFQRAYQRLESQLRQTYGDAYTQDLAKQLQLPWRAVNEVINQKILLQEADRLGLEATAGEVRKAILDQPVFRDENGRFVGLDEYSRILVANRLTEAQFEDDIRRDVKLNKLTSVLADSVFVSDSDLERSAREQTERAKIRYFRVPASELAGDVSVTPEELAEYFAQHREEYLLPERRGAGYLSLNINTIRAGLQIGEDELRAYYDEHPEEFTQQEQVRARHILLFVTAERPADRARREIEDLRRRVQAGEDFAKLAETYSEDEGTKSRGGDLGYFGRGRMTPQFEEAAFGAEVGALVGPVQNSLGTRDVFHLIEVMDHRAGGLQPFEEVENRIRVRRLSELARTTAETQAQELWQRLKSQTPGDEAAMRALAAEEGVAYEVVAPFAENDNVPNLGASSAFARAVFALEEGSYSEPIRIPAGWAIAHRTETLPPKQPELAEVEDQVRAALVAERQTEAAKAMLAELRDAVASGDRTFEDAAASLGTEIQDGGEVSRFGAISGLGRQPDIVSAALELEGGELGEPVATPLGLVLFQVTERSHFDPQSFADTKAASREQVVGEQLTTLLSALIAQRRTELEVSYDPAFVEQWELTDILGLAQL